MPWIRVIPENEATGELKEIYDRIAAQRAGEELIRDRNAGADGPLLSPPVLHSLNRKAMRACRSLLPRLVSFVSNMRAVPARPISPFRYSRQP